MREALIIVAVLLIILALTAFKYRKQIKTVVGVSRMIRNAAVGNAPQQPRIDEPVTSGKLVNCTKCGTWVPEGRAIKFGTSTYFCTDECLQRSIRRV